ncbi:MAG: beta-ketoacyl-[acyl-carrier-protein] synthase II, partial [Candidatus Eisenbacteria bacterium]|nr:beta-ketoacyl-[acyl-carrier-protein] synthase II [Candidatus Eisenbacteria bacterium]
MNRKVVVTGLGAITPLGNTTKEFWDGLVAGHSGITQLTRFDASDLTTQVGGEVKDFDPLLYLEKKEVRRNDLYV